MLELTRYQRDPWSIFDELESLQDDLNRAFGGWSGNRRFRRGTVKYPPLNVWSRKEGIVIDAELPGVDPSDVDISVVGDELTLSGKVNGHELQTGEAYHRRERPYGSFSRTLQLPFRAEAGAVKARYDNGLLRISVPRSEDDKPKKIAIEAA
jgi:HSP20 family protein